MSGLLTSLLRSKDKMKLTSPAFADRQPIPEQYTCKGENCSPPFEFLDVPKGTLSFVFLAEDMDAPDQCVHWLLYNLPATTTFIPESKSPEGAMEGLCLGGKNGYQAPCPKFFSGIHRFTFTLYALDAILEVPRDADRTIILQAMDGHIISQSQLTGVAEGDQVASTITVN